MTVGCPSPAHSKNINFIGSECPNFEGMDGSVGTSRETMSLFPKSLPISVIFLWALKHFIAVIYTVEN